MAEDLPDLYLRASDVRASATRCLMSLCVGEMAWLAQHHASRAAQAEDPRTFYTAWGPRHGLSPRTVGEAVELYLGLALPGVQDPFRAALVVGCAHADVTTHSVALLSRVTGRLLARWRDTHGLPRTVGRGGIAPFLDRIDSGARRVAPARAGSPLRKRLLRALEVAQVEAAIGLARCTAFGLIRDDQLRALAPIPRLQLATFVSSLPASRILSARQLRQRVARFEHHSSLVPTQ